MIQKEHLENFLNLNGIPPTAPEEEIRSALISARWNKDDVEVALMVLKGEQGSEEVEVVATRELFHSDKRIAPETLSSLLGVQVDLSKQHVHLSYRNDSLAGQAKSVAMLSIFSIAVAVGAVLGIMYYLKIGPFFGSG